MPSFAETDPARKAAIVLLALDKKDAAKVMKVLSQKLSGENYSGYMGT